MQVYRVRNASEHGCLRGRGRAEEELQRSQTSSRVEGPGKKPTSILVKREAGDRPAGPRPEEDPGGTDWGGFIQVSHACMLSRVVSFERTWGLARTLDKR